MIHANQSLPWAKRICVAITLVITTLCWGQTHVGCDGNCGGAASSGSACSGRCTYGVEGRCTPKSVGWGHYSTTWRKWPEPAPPVVRRPRSNAGEPNAIIGVVPLDLPEAGDETEANPEFRHLKPSDDLSVPTPAGEGYGDFGDAGVLTYPEQDVIPLGPSAEVEGGAVDLPGVELEGDSLGDGIPGLEFETRAPSRANEGPMWGNPLRSSVANPAPENGVRRVSYDVPVARRSSAQAQLAQPVKRPTYFPNPALRNANPLRTIR